MPNQLHEETFMSMLMQGKHYIPIGERCKEEIK